MHRTWRRLTNAPICCSLMLGALALTTIALGCGGGAGGSGGGGGDGTVAAKLETLSGARVFFGHNSVGGNIVEGLYDVLDEYPAPRPGVAATHDPAQMSDGLFAHDGIGGNEYPYDKIATFEELMTGDLGGAVDLAFFKFCFVDFQTTTWDTQANVDDLFAEYQDMVSAIHAAHPGLKLVHFTVPLSPQDEVNNTRRERISQKIRAAYGSDVFDLAVIESTNPSSHARITGAHGPMLYSGWADDSSGHLNAAGSRAVALELIAFLAEQVEGL